MQGPNCQERSIHLSQLLLRRMLHRRLSTAMIIKSDPNSKKPKNWHTHAKHIHYIMTSIRWVAMQAV